MAFGKTQVNADTGERTRSGVTLGGRSYTAVKRPTGNSKTVVHDKAGKLKTGRTPGASIGLRVEGERHFESNTWRGKGKKIKSKTSVTSTTRIGSLPQKTTKTRRRVAESWAEGLRGFGRLF